MRQNFILLVLFFLSFFYSNGQITFEGCATGTAGPVLGDFPNGNAQIYQLEHVSSENVGTRNTYITNPHLSCGGLGGGTCILRIIWIGSRWEIQLDQAGDPAFSFPATIYYNTSTSTPNPPSLNLGTWQEGIADLGGPGLCNSTPPSTLSGSVQDGLVLSTNNIDFKKIIAIYPNPTKGNLFINSNESIEKVEVYNYIGQKVLESNKYSINVNNLTRGMYLLKVYTANEKVVIKRFVKE